jgi:hypothetical protein
MSDPNNGTYPQAAGSFYNSAAMMPHSGGRVAPQIPTYGEGLPGLMNASRMQISDPNNPRNSSILAARSANMEAYYRAQDSSIGTATTGLNVLSGLTGVAGMFAGSTPLRALFTGVGGLGLGVGMAMTSSALDRFAKEKEKIRSVQLALSSLNLTGNQMSDPLTGSINYTAASQISNTLQAKIGGFKQDELKGVMDYATKSGALTGYTNNPKQLTDRIVQLAKVTKEIVDIGEGITAADAANMQTMLSGMGISASNISKKSLGKRLVMAGRTAGLTLDEINNLAQTSGQSYVQMGLSATQGVLAGAHSASSAKTLMGIGKLTEKDIAKLGGQEGIQQGLFKAGSASMSNLTQRLVMGTMKMSDNGEMIIDTDMLDMAVSGKLSLTDLDQRASQQMKRISKLDSKNRKLMMEQIQRSMPDLAEQVSENINAEQQMVLAGRGIQELRNKGMSVHSAMESFFGGDKQAIKAFTEYAKNLPSILQEQKRQTYLASQDKLLAASTRGFDYSKIDSPTNSVARLFKNIGESYDATVGFLFDPEGRARESLLREERAKYRNMGFVSGINSNSVLGTHLRNAGINKQAYTMTEEDLRMFENQSFNSVFGAKGTGDFFTLSGANTKALNTVTPDQLGAFYTMDELAAQEDVFKKTKGASQAHSSISTKEERAQILKDFRELKNANDKILKEQGGVKGSQNMKTLQGNVVYANGKYTVRRTDDKGRTYTEELIDDNQGGALMTNDAAVEAGIGRFLVLDKQLDPEYSMTATAEDFLMRDTDDILGIGYGDEGMDLVNEIRGEYYDSGFMEQTSKLFGGNIGDKDIKEATKDITNMGRTYKKLFAENSSALQLEKRKINAAILGISEDASGNALSLAYRSLKTNLQKKLVDVATDTNFSRTGDLRQLDYSELLKLMESPEYANLTENQKQALLQTAMSDIQEGTHDDIVRGDANAQTALALFQQTAQKAASLTQAQYGLTPESFDSSISMLSKDFKGVLKSFKGTEGDNKKLKNLLTIVQNKSIAKNLSTTDMNMLRKQLANQGLTLSKDQLEVAAGLLQNSSGMSGEELKALFGALTSTPEGAKPEDFNIMDNFKGAINKDFANKFIEEAQGFNNDLSTDLVKNLTSIKDNPNAVNIVGRRFAAQGKGILSALGADASTLSEDQRRTISRMENQAKGITNEDQRNTALGKAVMLAQQYINQNQNQTTEGGSKSLPAVMTEISQGLTNFNTTMTELKNALSSSGNVVKIELSAGASKQ